MDDADTWTNHVKPAADYVVANGPFAPQERWENQSCHSPGTMAAEITELICAADIASDNGDEETAELYEAMADQWQSDVEDLTVITNGAVLGEPRTICG